MDYDNNIYKMPVVGNQPAECILARRVEAVVKSYNARRTELSGRNGPSSSPEPTVQLVQVWLGICASHLMWSAWSRCFLSSQAHKVETSGGEQSPKSDSDIDNFPYLEYAQAREKLFEASIDVVRKTLEANAVGL